MTGAIPSVTVIMAVLNEAEFIDQVLGELLNQDYPGDYEVIVADGGSTDGTRDKLVAWEQRDGRVRVIDNPQVRQAFGLNLAAARARGEVLVRADGHTSFAGDYVRNSVDALNETGAAVGGPMSPKGRSPFGRAVAAAMNSPLTMGPGRFHHASEREKVDTVYLGAFRSADYAELGGFRSFPSGSSEDADFYFRWRESGGSVVVDPEIRSIYTPRDTPGVLWAQYYRYGLGKAEMWWVNGRPPSWRPLAPLLFVLALLAALAATVSGAWISLIAVLAPWIMTLMWVGARSEEPVLNVALAAGIMHLAYGLGMLVGMLTGRARAKRVRSQ